MRLSMRVRVFALALAFCPAWGGLRAEVVVDFGDLTVPAAGYFNGDPGTMPTGESWRLEVPWSSQGVEFSNAAGRFVDPSWSFSYWSGFAYSNVVDTTDGRFTNQYAAKPGGGVGGPGTTYAIAYGNGASITLPVPTTVAGFQIANTTYAYGIMAFPDPNNFSTPLGPTGWFATTATGKLAGSTTGTATWYLADLRGPTPVGIRDGWTWFPLAALGTVDTIEFTFEGSDRHPTFGLNTPAYFAMDDLTVAAVPEPATATLLGVAGLVGGLAAARRARRRRHVR